MGPVEITGFDLEAGSREYYVDVTFYDNEYKNRRADVNWYCEHYLEAPGPILELGVGSGRIALKAVRKGAVVTGIDMSPTMIAQAEAARQKLSKSKRGNLRLIEGDMRDFDLDTQFDVISCPFNAFQHLYTRDDVERCLGSIRRHLAPGGLFLMDVLNPDLDYFTRSPFKRYPGVRFLHPTLGVHYTYSEQSAWDPLRQINQMWFHFDRDPLPNPRVKRGPAPHDAPAPEDTPEHYVVQLSHRYFFPDELNSLLHYNGFEMLARFGDFDLGDLRPDSESMILMCRARE